MPSSIALFAILNAFNTMLSSLKMADSPVSYFFSIIYENMASFNLLNAFVQAALPHNAEVFLSQLCVNYFCPQLPSHTPEWDAFSQPTQADFPPLIVPSQPAYHHHKIQEQLQPIKYNDSTTNHVNGP